jgi:hypothetical protein
MYANYILIFQWNMRCEKRRSHPQKQICDFCGQRWQTCELSLTSSLQESHAPFNQNAPISFNILFPSIIYFSLVPETNMNSPIYIQLILMKGISHKNTFWKETKLVKVYISNIQLKKERLNRIRPPLWSSGQSSWLQIRRPGFDSRHYLKKKVVGLERGSLSLVSTTEELLDRKVAAPV